MFSQYRMIFCQLLKILCKWNKYRNRSFKIIIPYLLLVGCNIFILLSIPWMVDNVNIGFRTKTSKIIVYLLTVGHVSNDKALIIRKNIFFFGCLLNIILLKILHFYILCTLIFGLHFFTALCCVIGFIQTEELIVDLSITANMFFLNIWCALLISISDGFIVRSCNFFINE